MDANTGRRDDLPATVDGDVDRLLAGSTSPAGALGGADRGSVAERAASAVQHRRPGLLVPGQRAGVLAEHAGMDPRQLTPAHEPGDVVDAQAQVEQLAPGDGAVLFGQEIPGALVHDSRVRCRVSLGHAPARGLWTAA